LYIPAAIADIINLYRGRWCWRWSVKKACEIKLVAGENWRYRYG
jgi:hypothetical protein